ncbi:MAG: helix-turn-helix transcriptional regulator [Candidatus Aminicenantes bacterium]|nr:helix-turn-helix transcriptional regulator [Candidatus Aminicenantes bacterium]
MISRALTAASTKPLILAILKQGENYGYRIIQRVREISEGEIDWSEPMLYPVLKRMDRDGLLQSRWKHTENGRFRRYYRLTEKGHKELEREKAQWIKVHAAFMKVLSPVFKD